MLDTLKKVWSLLSPAERRKALGMLLLVTLMAAVETAGVLSIMPFLSVLANPDAIEGNWLLARLQQAIGTSDTRVFITLLGLASMMAVVGSSVFKTVTLHLVNRFIHFQRHTLSSRLLATYLQQPYEFFLIRNSAVLSKNVLSEVDQLVFNLFQPLSQLVAQGAIVVAMVGLVVWLDPVTAMFIVIAVGVLYASIYTLVRHRLGLIGREMQAANAKRYQACNEALGGIKDVKFTQSIATYSSRFDEASRQYSRHIATGETLAQSPLYIVEAAGYTGLILISLFLVSNANDITTVLPALGLYGFAAYRLLPAAQIMYRGFAKARFATAALDTIQRDLGLALPPAAPSMAAIVPQREIRLDRVRFAYPSAPDVNVLDGLSLTIPVNSSVGIVGSSGSGKSTVMDVLLGLLEPQQGGLIVDGEPIRGSALRRWQRAIGYVPQHIYLADTNVAQNIAFGVPQGEIDHDAVVRAARAAQIHDFIQQLPEGYGTSVGDRGVRLSGGQLQRIGIARALYRDPPVLLMDEATSALDQRTEEAVNAALRGLSGSKTIVLIAHKPSSVEQCDLVVRLEPTPRSDRPVADPSSGPSTP